jgi:tRNA G18 (ribose-2'-O)-methylase SpoU
LSDEGQPVILSVTDPDDPRIAGFRQVRERDLVGRDGLFVAEGEVVLRHLLTSPLVEPVAVLLAEKRVEKLADDVPQGVPLYAASQEVIDAIAGFHLHRGILALGRRRDPPSAQALLAGLGEQALVVCAFGIGNHDNMGGLFRNAAAFGADAVLLGEDCCDPLYRKAIRVSVGASLFTPWARVEGDPVALLQGQGFEVLSLTPSGSVELAQLKAAPRTAVLFGSEGPGLPVEILERTRTVRITMQSGFDSLNVATTSGIVLHHLTRL